MQSKVAELEPLKAQVNNLKQNTNIVKESNIKINELNEELLKLAYFFNIFYFFFLNRSKQKILNLS